MKPLLVSLAALSFLANLVLVGLLLAGRNAGDDRAALTARATASRPTAENSEPASDTWARLDAPEPAALVRQLREAGFPPHLVRAILAARVQESFAPRFKALRPPAGSDTFWKNANSADPRVRQAEFALYREQQKVLRDLLGADAESPEQSIYQHKRFDSVPAAKVQEVKDALRQFEDRRQEIYSTAMGTITPDQRRAVADAEKEFNATLASLLSPSELEEFNVRNSEVARNLRFELAAFQPTEEEFRAIYRLQATLEPYAPNMTQEEMQRRGEAQNRVREQVKAMLGPVRAEEYVRASDFSYRQTTQLVARLELPPETTSKIWEVKSDLDQRALALRRDTSLSPSTRTQQLAALADDASQRVATLLGGQRGLEAFKQNGGYWIDALRPRPVTGSTTTTTTIMTRGP